jgi:hypothetical protein
VVAVATGVSSGCRLPERYRRLVVRRARLGRPVPPWRTTAWIGRSKS